MKAILFSFLSLMTLALPAQTISLKETSNRSSSTFRMGTAVNPDGKTFLIDSKGILVEGQPLLPVMGEIHYARVPQKDWKREILKMKAGGVTIISTYAFWIHHEPKQGQWDWTGNKNLRQFVETCKECDVPLVLRIGPFCHGEVYQGGMPEWIVNQSIKEGFRLRTNSRQWMEATRNLYQQISRQVEGLLWKDGGPIVGIQVENESRGPWAYLAELKQTAIEAGLDVPFYTRTGWPQMNGKAEFGEILPLYGDYADGFWDRELTDMPGAYSDAFTFKNSRLSAVIASETFGRNQSTEMDISDLQYPYLTCELGGGMTQAYHRRINIFPKDALALAICKVGSGSNLPGYYMYHGGTNPYCEQHSMGEMQNSAVTNYNDSPYMTYDFQAPLGEMGQMNPSFHYTRIFHQMLDCWGSELSDWDVQFPQTNNEKGKEDTTLRWTVRTDGTRGFIFINNYLRMGQLSTKSIQFNMTLSDGSMMTFPKQKIDISDGASFAMPFNISGIDYAFAQLFGIADNCLYLVEVEGVKPIVSINGKEFVAKTDKEYKLADGSKMCVLSFEKAKSAFIINGNLYESRHDGIIYSDGEMITEEWWKMGNTMTLNAPTGTPALRAIRMGGAKVAEQPTEADFNNAKVWTFLPEDLPEDDIDNTFLLIDYQGDVARVYADGQLVEDNFWNGKPFYVRMSSIANKKVEIKILPLGKDYPIYLQSPQRDILKNSDNEFLLNLSSVKVVKRMTETKKRTDK